MNIDLEIILQWFSSLGRPYPARDWAAVAVVSIVLTLAGAALAGYLFWGTQTGTIVAASQNVPRAPVPVSREAIKKVLEIYEARATNYAGRNFIVVDVIDPRPTRR